MLHNVFFTTLFLFFTLVSSSSSDDKMTPSHQPRNRRGITLPLIPPTSLRSPFYTQILESNNLSTTMKNVTLDRSHYLEWLIQSMSPSLDDYGEISYSKDLSYHVLGMHLGDPVQLVYGLFDTGSRLVWFQCEEHHGKGKFPYFKQSKSSTYKPVNCWDVKRCNKTILVGTNCYNPRRTCQYLIKYAGGTHVAGIVATDVNTFKPDWVIQPLIFGCAKEITDNTIGIIGASNGEFALPSQLFNDPKFSYCISSDLKKTSLVKFGPDTKLSGNGFDMVKNRYRPYYYIDVVDIQVDGDDLDLRPDVFEMSDNGSKGFIIDSGTALTHITSVAFDALKKRIEQSLGPSTKYWIFELCYPPSKVKVKPAIGFMFGDFSYQFPDERMWAKMKNGKIECMQLIREKSGISILGSDLLLDVNVGHDPTNDRLYLEQTSCPTA